MPLARISTPSPQDAPASEAAAPQKAHAALVYDIARRPASASRRALAAIFNRAPAWISRKVVVAACALAFVLLLAFVAYAFRRPASPLPPGALLLNQNVQQNVPFGPVTITPSAVKSGPGTANTALPVPRPAIPKPSAARRAAKLRWHPRQDDSSAANLNQQSDIQ